MLWPLETYLQSVWNDPRYFGTSQNYFGTTPDILERPKINLERPLISEVWDVPKFGTFQILGRSKILERPKFWNVPKFGFGTTPDIFGTTPDRILERPLFKKNFR